MKTPSQTQLIIGSVIGLVTITGILIVKYFWGSPKKTTPTLYASTTLYRSLVDKDPIDNVVFTLWGGKTPCPGSQVMNGFTFGALTCDNILRLSNRMHRVVQVFWTWKGIPTLFRGDEFLDGAIKSNIGECGVIADALKVLLSVPPPYGAGLDAKLFSTGMYMGKKGLGFISNHVGSPLGLSANIYNKSGKRQPYYLWENHKVVAYTYTEKSSMQKTVYFDPNYATTQGGDGSYEALQDMAVLQVSGTIPIDEDSDPFKGKLVTKIATVTDNSDRYVGIFIVCEEYDADLKILCKGDKRLDNGDPAKLRTIVIGPLTVKDGFDPDAFDFVVANDFLDKITLTN